MKLATVGKGGSGKTTVAGTLARIFAEEGTPILAIDGDPNPNLALTLGMSRKDADQINYCLLYTSPSPRDLSTSRMPSSA